MKLLKYIVNVFILVLSISTTYAASSLQRDNDTMYFNGSIMPKDMSDLYTEFDKQPFSTLILNSGGGDFDEGIKLGQFVQANNVKIRVTKFCASSCTFAFFMAYHKEMDDTAYLVLHNISMYSEDAKDTDIITIQQAKNYSQEAAIASSKMILLYARAGIPLSVLDLVAVSTGQKKVLISKNDLIRFKILKKD